MMDKHCQTSVSGQCPRRLTALSSVLLLAAILVLLIAQGDLAFGKKGLNLDIATVCENELDLRSLDDFDYFIENLKDKSEEQLKKEGVPKNCIRDREAIIELAEVISRKEVCDSYKIDELIKYHKQYFKPNRFIGGSRPITHKFFTKYAIQVAYTCKKNLIRNLEIAREELKARSKVFDEARDRVMNEVPDIKTNIKLIEEQPDDPVSTNVKPQDDAELTLSNYREALTKLRQPEDIYTFDRDDCERSKKRETRVASDKLQIFFKPALMCHQLHRYYAGSLLSIAKLANYGYKAVHPDLDAQISESPMIRDWIIAVQVCDPMLYLGTKEVRDGWASVDTCSQKVAAIESMVYDDQIDELDIELLEEMVPKSGATRSKAHKLMNSALKTMAKVDIMRQLKNGTKKKSIFSKGLSMFKSDKKLEQTAENPIATAVAMSKFTIQLTGEPSSTVGIDNQDLVTDQLSDEESFELLMKVINDREGVAPTAPGEDDGVDDAVSFIDPVSTLVTTLTVLAIMITFEWLFFIVMTLAARICHQLYFNFDNILTFPPKFLSWSDADFAQLNDNIEKMDEDDLFDYDELTPDEQKQRDLLAKVFSRPPPMLYRD